MPTSPSILLFSDSPDRSWDSYLPFLGFLFALGFGIAAERQFALIDRIEIVSRSSTEVVGRAAPSSSRLSYSYVWQGEAEESSVRCYQKGPCRWLDMKPGKMMVRIDPKTGLSFPKPLLEVENQIKDKVRFSAWVATFLAGFSIFSAFGAQRFL